MEKQNFQSDDEDRHRLVSIIIPCYQEANHLRSSIAEIDRVMKNSIWRYELIFVEDGSDDSTASIIRELLQEAGNRQAIFHKTNMGRGKAVASGMRVAEGEVAGFLDIDLEVPASYIPEAVSHIIDLGKDMVVGRRDYRIHLNPSDLIRHFLSACYRNLAHALLPIPVYDSEAGFKFFRRERFLPLLDQIKSDGWFWDTESTIIAAKNGLAIGEFNCLFVRRANKASTVKPVSDSIGYFRALFSFRKRMAGQP